MFITEAVSLQHSRINRISYYSLFPRNASVRQPVRRYVKRVHCDKTHEPTMSMYQTKDQRLYQQWLVVSVDRLVFSHINAAVDFFLSVPFTDEFLRSLFVKV